MLSPHIRLKGHGSCQHAPADEFVCHAPDHAFAPDLGIPFECILSPTQHGPFSHIPLCRHQEVYPTSTSAPSSGRACPRRPLRCSSISGRGWQAPFWPPVPDPHRGNEAPCKERGYPAHFCKRSDYGCWAFGSQVCTLRGTPRGHTAGPCIVSRRAAHREPQKTVT